MNCMGYRRVRLGFRTAAAFGGLALLLWIAAGSTHAVSNYARAGDGGSAEGWHAEHGVHTAHAEESYSFTNLGEMVATSDLVVEATVESVAPGEVYEEVPGEIEGRIEFNDVFIRIDHVHFNRGNLPVTTGDLLLVEEMRADSGHELVVNNVQHSLQGDSGFYYLSLETTRMRGSEAYFSPYLVSSQGRYLVQSDGTLKGSNPEDPLVQQLEQLQPAEMRQEITEARDAIARGEVLPLPPPVFCATEAACIDDTPAVDVTTQASASAGGAVAFSCTATAVNGAATFTSIESCTFEDRNNTNAQALSADPVRMPGPVATTHNEASHWFPPYSNDTWICWRATAEFDDGSSNLDEGCLEVVLDPA